MRFRFLLTLFVFVLVFQRVDGQILKNTNINLNAGGVIYDAVYIPQNDSYVIVGDFTSVNGQARRNVAILNSSLALSTFNPISSINGTIKTVEFNSQVISGTRHNYLVLGGDFTQINGQPREGLLLLTSTGTVSDAFTIHNWNYYLFEASGPSFEYDGVKDLKFYGDTLFVGGSFNGVNLTATNPTAVSSWSNCLFALKMAPVAASRFTYVTSQSTMLVGDEVGTGFLKKGTNVYVAQMRLTTPGSSNIERRNASLNVLSTLSHWSAPNSGHYLLEPLNDSLFISGFFGAPFGTSYGNNMSVFKYTGTASLGSNAYDLINYNAMTGSIYGYKVYNGDLFQYKSGPILQRYQLASTLTTGKLNFTTIGASIPITNSLATTADSINNLHVLGKYLFVSDRGITQVNGSSRTGAAIFCLEPTNPTGTLSGTVSVCPNTTITYTFQDVEFNSGYRISYTGSNAEVSIDGGTTWIPLNTPYFWNITGTGGSLSFMIRYALNATSGSLQLAPYNTCNTATDYQFAKSLTQNITIFSLPDLTITPTNSIFTCLVDTITVQASSTALNPSFEWQYNNSLMQPGSSITIGGTGNLPGNYPDGWYNFRVTDVNGCVRKDSVFISEDFSPPTLQQSDINLSPALWDCTTDTLVFSATLPNTSIYFTPANDTTILLPNPHQITDLSITQFKAYATSSTTGCIAEQPFTIEQNDTVVQGAISGMPFTLGMLFEDTISCATPNLNVICEPWIGDPNAVNSVASWVLNNVEIGNTLTVAAADTSNAVNQILTYTFVITNLENGCKENFNMLVHTDFAKPFIGNTIGSTTVNCSVDSVLLLHEQTGGNVVEGWLDAGGIQTLSATILADTGLYVYQVMDAQNACVSLDSIEVVRTNELLVQTTSDTLVCEGTQVPLTVMPMGYSGTVSWSWPDGSTSSNFVATGADTVLYVIGTTLDGCFASDSIVLSVNEPISIQTQSFVSCGDESGSLQITQTLGGAGGYNYSLDGANFSASPLFDSLSAGNYTITVRDALGCEFLFSAQLDGSASAPEPEFLVATYSQFGNTLALVNTTFFVGFDSMQWVFPPGILVDSLYDSVAFVQALDTGWYKVSLIGYVDTCSYVFDKEFHVDELAPMYPEISASLRIQETLLFPNPTTNSFQLDITFGIKQDYSILIVDDASKPVPGMLVKGDALNCSHTFSFPPGSATGTYRVIILSTYDALTLPVQLTN